jgi:kynurenine formamidase
MPARVRRDAADLRIDGRRNASLLGAGVVILEGLALHGVPPGEYTLIALPPRLLHSEAAPVRAVLVTPGEL